jgi:hypothetical protein
MQAATMQTDSTALIQSALVNTPAKNQGICKTRDTSIQQRSQGNSHASGHRAHEIRCGTTAKTQHLDCLHRTSAASCSSPAFGKPVRVTRYVAVHYMHQPTSVSDESLIGDESSVILLVCSTVSMVVHCHHHVMAGASQKWMLGHST